jgi:hypothetical protein
MHIKDYLHFYAKAEYSAIPQHALDRQPVECFIKTIYSDGTEIEMIGIDGGPAFFSFYDDIKPILRPLSSMTEEEMKHIWKLIFKRDFIGNNILWFDTENTSTAKRWVLSSGVERLGIEMSGHIWADSDLHHYKYNPYFVTIYLLSRGFDLFGLIPAGLALDRTTP